ncbi:MAG: hypothetical protein ACK4G3_05840, partial [bacterium]
IVLMAFGVMGIMGGRAEAGQFPMSDANILNAEVLYFKEKGVFSGCGYRGDLLFWEVGFLNFLAPFLIIDTSAVGRDKVIISGPYPANCDVGRCEPGSNCYVRHIESWWIWAFPANRCVVDMLCGE